MTRRRDRAGDASGIGPEFAKEVADEDLLVASVQRGSGCEPALLWTAEKVWSRGIGEQEDHDIDESGQSQREDMAQGRRGE